MYYVTSMQITCKSNSIGMSQKTCQSKINVTVMIDRCWDQCTSPDPLNSECTNDEFVAVRDPTHLPGTDQT